MFIPCRSYLPAVLACGVLWTVWIAFYCAESAIVHEHGPMENQQAICLGLTSLLFLAAARHATTRASRCLVVSLSLFAFMFLLRELELDRTRAPRAIQYLFSGARRNVIILCSWAALALMGWKERRLVWRVFIQWVRMLPGKLMLAAGLLYALTWPLDKEFLPLPKRSSMFVEELGDSGATLLMFLSAAYSVV